MHTDTNKQKVNDHDHNVQGRPNPRTHRTSEVNTRGTGNPFNNIKAENSPSPEEETNIQTQATFRTPNRQDQGRTSPWHLIVKMSKIQSTKQVLNCCIEKNTNSPTKAKHQSTIINPEPKS